MPFVTVKQLLVDPQSRHHHHKYLDQNLLLTATVMSSPGEALQKLAAIPHLFEKSDISPVSPLKRLQLNEWNLWNIY